MQLLGELNRVRNRRYGDLDESGALPFEQQAASSGFENVRPKSEKISERLMEYVERPERELKGPRLTWLKSLLMPVPKKNRQRKQVLRLDTPGLTLQQKIWLGTQTIISSLLPLLLYMVLPAFMMYVGMVVRHWKDGAAAFVNASGNFYYAVGIVLCFLLIRFKLIRGGENFQDAVTLYWEEPDWSRAAGYVLLGVSSSIFLSAVFTLLPFFTGYKNLTENAFQRTDLALAMLSVLITAPICEEMIFRGLMLNRLLTRFSEKAAVLLTSAVFAACHVNPAWMCYAFIMGWLLAFVSLKEDNIFYSIILHMAFNLWTVIQLIIRRWDWLERFLFGSKVLIFGYGLVAFLAILAWYRVHPDFSEAAGDWIRSLDIRWKTGADVDSEMEPDTETETESNAEPEVELDTETEIESNAEPDAEPDLRSDAGTESGTIIRKGEDIRQ